MRNINWIGAVVIAGFAALSQKGAVDEPAVEAVRVIARPVERKVQLPGEFVPYLKVPIHAKVGGFVDKIEVDRGSAVKEGQLLATIVAPELQAQRAEAEAKVQAAESQKAEAEARLVAAESTYEKMKAASQTPGVIAGNELVQAEKQVDAERAKVRAIDASIVAARAAVRAIEDIQAYLRVTAPFSGVITERNIHPGALVGTRADSVPMFQLETVNRLRLIVPVPEAQVGGIVRGARVPFTVPAYPNAIFHGTVSRISHSIDVKTRSMAVELDVWNADGRLAAGMYPIVTWPVRESRPVLLVPPTSIAVNSERIFVVRVKNGIAEWVNIRRGPPEGDLIEVYGPLQDGDVIVRRGTDEIREGTRLNVRIVKM